MRSAFDEKEWFDDEEQDWFDEEEEEQEHEENISCRSEAKKLAHGEAG